MKKNYIQPISKLHSISIRPIMDATSSILDGGDNSTNDEYHSEDATLGHSIWDDTCGDGFNW